MIERDPKTLWSAVLWRLMACTPSAWASSGPMPVDLEDSFRIWEQCHRLMNEEAA
jgi:hypothetical protein